MATDPHLGLELLQKGDRDPHVLINAAIDRLSKSDNAVYVIVAPGGGGVVNLESGGSTNYVDNTLFQVTGSPTGPVTLVVPDGERRANYWNDMAAQLLLINTETGSTAIPILNPDELATIHSLGTDLQKL